MNTYTPDSTKIVHETNVDFNNKMIGPVVHIRQYDVSLPIVKVKLYNAGAVYSLPENTEANIRFGKGDGTYVYNPVLGCNDERSVLYFEISQQMALLYGEKKATIELIQNGVNVANSSLISIDIEKNPVQDSDIESTDEVKTLIGYVTQAKESEENAKASEESAIASAATAVESSLSAMNSATSAENDAIASANSAFLSDRYAKDSQSYAVGGTGERAGEDSDNSKYYYEQAKEISSSLAGVLQPHGTIAFEELPTDVTDKHGWMYNISNDFVSDERFKDGGGISYKKGTNLYITVEDLFDCLASENVTSVNGMKGDVEILIPKPDDDTITMDPDGTLHGTAKVDIATTEKAGVVKPDGETITIDEDGTIRSTSGNGDIDVTKAEFIELQKQGLIKPDTNYFVKNWDGRLESLNDDILSANGEEYKLKWSSESRVLAERIEGRSEQGSYNLIDISNSATKSGTTSNGITWVVNKDGSLTANGTATATSQFIVSPYATNGGVSCKGTVALSGLPSTGSASTFRIGGNYVKNNAVVSSWGLVTSDTTIDIGDNDGITIIISIYSGYVANNLTFKPMLVEVAEDGSYPTEFVRGYGTPSPTNPVDIVSVGDSVNLLSSQYEHFYTRGQVRSTSTFDEENGIFTITPTAVTSFPYLLYDFVDLPKGTYTISFNSDFSDSICHVLGTNDRSTFTTIANGTYAKNPTLTFINDGTYKYIRIQMELKTSAVVGTTYTFTNLMLNRGSVAKPYRPYGDGIRLVENGKNVISFPYFDVSKSTNGITWTLNEDGSVTANGTATANSIFYLHKREQYELNDLIVPNGKYIISGCPRDGSSSKYGIRVEITKNGSASRVATDYGDGAEAIVSGDDYYSDSASLQIVCVVNSGYTADNLTFYPMLVEVSEDGTYPTDYEIYREHETTIPIEPLRSIGDVKDTIDFVDGEWVLTRRIKHHVVSKLTYVSVTDGVVHVNSEALTELGDSRFVTWNTNALSNRFKNNGATSKVNGNMWMGSNRSVFAFQIADASITNTDSANAWLSNNPIYVDYILATPTTEKLSADQVKALCSIHSFEDKTYISCLNDVKPQTEIEYATTHDSGVALMGFVNSIGNDNEIKSVQTSIGEELVVEEINISWALSASSATTVKQTADIKEGYTPIGILGILISGTGAGSCYLSDFRINEYKQIAITYRNDGSSYVQATITVNVLYKRISS